MSEYQAGVCNIGPSEIKKRQRVAVIGYAVALAIFIAMNFLDSSLSVALFFIAAFVGSVGFVQSRKKFCLAFGLAGTFNVSETMKKVINPEDLKADRKTALTILGQSALSALVITAIFVAVPL